MMEPLSDEILGLDGSALSMNYRAAVPFPHLVIDGVLCPESLRQALETFPSVNGPQWTNYLHVNERKFGNTKRDTWGKSLQAISESLTSKDFIAFLEELTGIQGLFPDTEFDGGGLHRSLAGGFLNIHADFTAHHKHPDWQRRVNLLLYFNEDWDETWGGDLELWSSDMKQCMKSISPQANRMVIFTTTPDAFHGHPTPLACPPGVARKSLALYYFSHNSNFRPRPTDYRSRPGDGLKRTAIYLDKKALSAYDIIKRRLRISDETVSKWLIKLQRKTDS